MDRLAGLGLVDRFPDVHDSRQPAVAVNPLAAGRLAPLSEGERVAVAKAVTEPLLAAWGGAGTTTRRVTLDLQLTRLGLHADHPGAVAACAVRA